MISIRLSEDEYLGLKRLCAITGARSVSDLARDAMSVLLNGGQGVDGLGARMDEFRMQMRAIERKIDDLPSRISPSVKR
jgi:methyl-accepting chemotaxis protein